MTDVFDKLMNTTCQITHKVKYDGPGVDKYGHPDQTLINDIRAWPCRVSVKGAGNEYKIGKESAKSTHVVFMRPPTADDVGTPFKLTVHNYLILLDSTILNILSVNNPSLLDHHYEVQCEQVIT